MATTFTLPAGPVAAGTYQGVFDTPGGSNGAYVTLNNSGWPAGTIVTAKPELSSDAGATYYPTFNITLTEATVQGKTGAAFTISTGFPDSSVFGGRAMTNARVTVTVNKAITMTQATTGGWQ